MGMDDICDSCGERNPPHTAFCQSCNNYLGWEIDGSDASPAPVPDPEAPTEPAASSAPYASLTPPRAAPPTAREDAHGTPPIVGVDPGEWVVTPGGVPITVPVRVANQSTIVDAYRVVVQDQPDWLQAEAPELRLLPGTDESVTLALSVVPGVMVDAQQLELILRVESIASATLYADVGLYLYVGVVKGEMGLTLEPTTVRMKDETSAHFRIVVDNKHSNESLWASLKGSDSESAVTFTFSPAHLDVPAGRSLAAKLDVEAPLPEPGREVSRSLRITVAEGRRKVETTATLIQSTSTEVVDPPLSMRLDPSLIRVQNRSAGSTRVVVDNRQGSRPRQVKVTGYDNERVVSVSVSPATFVVPPGQTASAQVHLRAPRPGGGQEAMRPLTLSAWDGEQTAKAEGTFHQISSNRGPMARLLLTLIGASLMVLGVFMPWTRQQPQDGNDWTYKRYADALDIPNVPDVPTVVPNLVVSGGIIVILLAIMTVAGLIGDTGKATRVGAVLCLLWIVAFVVVLSFVSFNDGPSTGAFVIGLGCVLAFIGGVVARK
ncbi:MAG: hypothetical protein WA912_06850 [Ornithinimicrobium sp.]